MEEKRNYRSKSEIQETMQKVLNELLDHLEEEISTEKLIEKFAFGDQYFHRVFRSYFEMPYHKFLKRLRLRYAAEEVLKGNSIKGKWKQYGFDSGSAFSNAFKKEFGKAARELLPEDLRPDFFARHSLFGVPVSFRIERQPEIMLKTEIIECRTDFDHDPTLPYAYGLGEVAEKRKRGDKEPCYYGMWWHDPRQTAEIFYAYGKPDPTGEGYSVKLPADTYAVFSVPLQKTITESRELQNLLAPYIFREWKTLNHVTLNCMGVTYEAFTEDAMEIHVPFLSQAEYLHSKTELGLAKWAEMIDDNIRKNLTLHTLAGMVNYSEKSFREIFTLYYGIDPMKYVEKKRLYLAAGELDRKPDDVANILKEFRFDSEDAFRHQFAAEFGSSPENYLREKQVFAATDLEVYCQDHQEKLQIRFRQVEAFAFKGSPIQNKIMSENKADIAEFAAWHFKDNEGKYPGQPQAAIWKLRAIIESFENAIYDYVLGPVSEGLEDGTATVSGGRYAIIHAQADHERNLAEEYRMLTRCAFFGWIRDNRYRYDGSRVTFVYYSEGILYFCIPVSY